MTTVSENKLDISHDEFWDELYKDIPIPLQPGEKSIPMMMLENNVTGYHCMERQVKKWIKEGKLTCVGDRIGEANHYVKAYRKP